LIVRLERGVSLVFQFQKYVNYITISLNCVTILSEPEPTFNNFVELNTTLKRGGSEKPYE